MMEGKAMTKSDWINSVIYDMTGYMDENAIDRLKVTLTCKLTGWKIVEAETHLSTEVRDNGWILQRYMIDLAASCRAK